MLALAIIAVAALQVGTAIACFSTSSGTVNTDNSCTNVLGGSIVDVSTPASYPGSCRFSLNPVADCNNVTITITTNEYISDENCYPANMVLYSTSTSNATEGINSTCYI